MTVPRHICADAYRLHRLCSYGRECYIVLSVHYIADPKVHTRTFNLQKNTTPPKNLTYVQYLTTLTSTMYLIRNPKEPDSTPQLPKNGKILISTDSPPPSSTKYERIIVHAAEVKFINNRYTIPITVEFGSSESENSVNLPVKHRKCFIAINLLDPSASIAIKDKVITNPQEFPMGTEYTECFDVITDKKTKFPRFFVHHDIHSTLIVSAMKYSNHNMMSTLQSLRTWVTFNKSDTHLWLTSYQEIIIDSFPIGIDDVA